VNFTTHRSHLTLFSRVTLNNIFGKHKRKSWIKNPRIASFFTKVWIRCVCLIRWSLLICICTPQYFSLWEVPCSDVVLFWGLGVRLLSWPWLGVFWGVPHIYGACVFSLFLSARVGVSYTTSMRIIFAVSKNKIKDVH